MSDRAQEDSDDVVEEEEKSQRDEGTEPSKLPKKLNYITYVKHLIDNDRPPIRPRELRRVLRRHIETKQNILDQIKLKSSMRQTLTRLLKLLPVVDSSQILLKQFSEMKRLGDCTKEKEDLITKFVKLKNKHHTVLAKQAAEHLIECQIEQQKVMDGQSQETDPEKEARKQELNKCKETLASLKQELEAKNRSLKYLREMQDAIDS